MQPQQAPNYDFIMSPNQPKKQFNLPIANATMPVKIGVVVGGFILLVIIFAIGKSILSPNPPLDSVFMIAQDQQAILHLVQNADTVEQASQSFGDHLDNFNANSTATLTSGQQQVITYLRTNGYKAKPADLNLRINAQYDTQLTSAAQSGTYPDIYTGIMKHVLTVYSSDIAAAYDKNPGANGQKLLKENYAAVKLLQKQLEKN